MKKAYERVEEADNKIIARLQENAEESSSKKKYKTGLNARMNQIFSPARN